MKALVGKREVLHFYYSHLSIVLFSNQKAVINICNLACYISLKVGLLKVEEIFLIASITDV